MTDRYMEYSIDMSYLFATREIMMEDKDRLKKKPKAKWNYLQKYYHKGAFYRTFDEKDEIADESKWDFNQPTLEDRFVCFCYMYEHGRNIFFRIKRYCLESCKLKTLENKEEPNTRT